MTKYVRQELESAFVLGALGIIVVGAGVLAWKANSPAQAPGPAPTGSKPPAPPPLPTNPPPPAPSSLIGGGMIYEMVYTWGLDFTTGTQAWTIVFHGWVPLNASYTTSSQAAAYGGGALYKYVVTYDPSGQLGVGWQGSCVMDTWGKCLPA